MADEHKVLCPYCGEQFPLDQYDETSDDSCLACPGCGSEIEEDELEL